MTRKDYELIAATLREDAAHLASGEPFDYSNAPAWERGAYDQWSTTVLAFGRALQADNPRFEAERFYSAAGFRGGAQRALDVDARSLANAADMGVYSEINPASDEEAE